jgi:3-hydroxyacyl-CoA dehydrogenase / enoyl-CoA hydratase / 3-hydroxybutyryl-CoA epimerase
MEQISKKEKSLVTLDVRDDGIAIVYLAGDEQKIPVLRMERMEELESVLSSIEQNSEIKGVVIIGEKSSGFCAGADIHAIKGVSRVEDGESLALQGQRIFDRIEKLKAITVAAISGACVGGGCELVLSCNYRIMFEGKIGLPETKLGILPGFGGTQRLPRLIGVTSALEIILQGKVVDAKRAKKIGLVDEILVSEKESSFQNLLSRAIEIAKGNKSPQKKQIPILQKILGGSSLGRKIVETKTREKLDKETKGKYPAPYRALSLVLEGLAIGQTKGLELEARALGEMIVTPECKSLINIYFQTENASKLGKSAKSEISNAVIGVMGGGVMGAGIATSFIVKGYKVVLLEPVAETRDKAVSSLKKSLLKKKYLSDAKREELLGNLKVTEDIGDLKDSSLVVEAIIEDLEVKRQLFLTLSEVLSDEAIIASNTSSLSINELAVGIKNPERFVGMHFFNPVEQMPLIEIIRAEKTSNKTLSIIAAFTTALGKFPIVVEDVPGFLVNRVLSAYIAESGQLLAEGYSIVDIDKAAVNFGMPMGPFRMLDEVGLDIAAKVQEIISSAYGKRMEAPHYPKKLLEKGRKGKKSGSGFYNYVNSEAIQDDAIYAHLGLQSSSRKPTGDELENRLFLALLNEVFKCLEEGVAGVKSQEAIGQIDLGTVMGMGFPPYKGGALFYAKSLGTEELQKRFDKFKKNGIRFDIESCSFVC